MPQYKYQDVTVPTARGNVVAHGINDRGQITGSYLTQEPLNPYPNAFIARGSQVDTIPLTNAGQHDAYGINNFGQVSGTVGDAFVGIRGFLWSPDHPTQPQTVAHASAPVSGLSDQARGVNDFGTVVGTDYVGHHEGFVWRNGQMSFIQYPGAAFTDANGISDTGIIVGDYSAGAGTPNHAFVEAFGRMREITVPGAVSAEANGISAAGAEIVGTYQDATGHDHGWTDIFGQVRTFDLPGATDTRLYGVNDFGQVVGSYSRAGDPDPHGFVATPDNVRLGSGPFRNATFFDPSHPVLPVTS